MAHKPSRLHCIIKGFSESPEVRSDLRREFSKFGQITKIYVHPESDFAKVYFENDRSCEAAVNGIRNNSFGWRVVISDRTRDPEDLSSSSSTMDENFLDVGTSNEILYTVHGHIIPALETDDGQVYVSLDDVKKYGFGVFTKSDLNNIKYKRKVVLEDFYQYMLTQASDYLLQSTQLGEVITEQNICNVIERCKKTLLGESNENNTRNEVRSHQPPRNYRSPNQSTGNAVPSQRYSMEGGRQPSKNERPRQRDGDRRSDQNSRPRNKSESRRSDFNNKSNDRNFNNNSNYNNRSPRNEVKKESNARVEVEESFDDEYIPPVVEVKDEPNIPEINKPNNTTVVKSILKTNEEFKGKTNDEFEEKPTPCEKDNDVEESITKQNTVETEKELDDSKKCFFDLPQPLQVLKNGDQVKIIDRLENNFVVKTKECFEKSKEILEYIKNLDKSTLLLNEVKEGQLILCAKDGAPNLCRAVVASIDSLIATVTYLDYPGEENLSIKSLRNVDEYLSKQPICVLFTPEIKLLDSLSDKSLNYIDGLVERKAKVTLVISDSDFDMKFDDGSTLSQKLLELEKAKEVDSSQIKVSEKENKAVSPQNKQPELPKAKSEPETPKRLAETESFEKVLFGEIPAITPPVGSSGRYVCSHFKEDELTLVSMEDHVLSQFTQLNDWLQNYEDTRQYEPELAEMCLVSYRMEEGEEPAWYRGAVSDIIDDSYDISLVDCGLMARVTKEDIRRFPSGLKQFSMLGIFCELVDLPDVPEAKEKLKLLIREGTHLEVTFKNYDEDAAMYQVVAPSIYTNLKKQT